MKTFINNLQESLVYNVVLYSGDELYSILNNVDNRRLLYIYDPAFMTYFSNDTEKWNQNFQYFVCWKGLDIVGIAKCQINQNYEEGKVLELQYLEVTSIFQSKGFASLLCKKIFDFCKKSNYIFKTCNYSKLGEKKLKPLFERLSNEKEVPFIDLDVTDEIFKNFEFINAVQSHRINNFF